jgi:hypothetical protein
VEFAFIAPVLLALVLGVITSSQLYDMQSQLSMAAREGARLAAMDRSDILGDGQSTNQKITNDIRNFLDACGLPGDEVEVSITEVDNPGVTFDLDDPNNDLELFQLRVELPYSLADWMGIPGMGDYSLMAQVVFRNARATIVQ